MGILGLTTFVANNSKKLLENYWLHDSVLIVDGNSLCIRIFQDVIKCNSAFGGDYNVYAKAVKKFFETLFKCNVTPYVVFDGGYEDSKLKTVLKRLRCRIVDAYKINPTNQSSFLVLPLLLKDVFLEILFSLNIKFVFCEFEADREIAIIARYLDCPVLSYDSDFYIYNVKYIPHPTLQHKTSIYKKSDGSTFHYLKCKIYKVENFLKSYSIDVDVLPLIATFLGNDYVKRSTFSKFFHNLKESKSKTRNAGQCRISALIQWFKNESYESAVEKVLNRFRISQRKFVLRCINKSCTMYTTQACESLNYFGFEINKDQNVVSSENSNKNDKVLPTNSTVNESNSDNESDLSDENNSSCDDLIPYESDGKPCEIISDWIKQLLCSGKISSKFYDLIHKSLYISSPQAEDFTKPDSNLASMPILIFSYNIIKNFNGSTLFYEGRNGIKQKRMEIDTKYDTAGIEKYWIKKNINPGREVFFHFLERSIKNEHIVKVLEMPQDIQMIALTIHWMMNSNVEHVAPEESSVGAITLCYIAMLMLNRHDIKETTLFEFKSKYSNYFKQWTLESKCNPVLRDKNINDMHRDLAYQDSMLATLELLKYFSVDQNMLSSYKLYRKESLHFFAEYQSCLQQLTYLNVLCSEPFSGCKFSETYNGTFIYNMYHNLRKRNNVLAYVTQLLTKSPLVLSFYLRIMQVLGYNIEVMPTKTSVSNPKKKRKQKENKSKDSEAEKSPSGDECESDSNLCDVNNKFHLLDIVSS